MASCTNWRGVEAASCRRRGTPQQTLLPDGFNSANIARWTRPSPAGRHPLHIALPAARRRPAEPPTPLGTSNTARAGNRLIGSEVEENTPAGSTSCNAARPPRMPAVASKKRARPGLLGRHPRAQRRRCRSCSPHEESAPDASAVQGDFLRWRAGSRPWSWVAARFGPRSPRKPGERSRLGLDLPHQTGHAWVVAERRRRLRLRIQPCGSGSRMPSRKARSPLSSLDCGCRTLGLYAPVPESPKRPRHRPLTTATAGGSDYAAPPAAAADRCRTACSSRKWARSVPSFLGKTLDMADR